MAQFTKKPVTIEAVQFQGDVGVPEIVALDLGSRRDGERDVLLVPTNHGEVIAEAGDWIIRQVDGELYPCKDSVFRATYVVASRPADATGAPALSQTEAAAVVETKAAPKVTEAEIVAKIQAIEYFRSRTLTICVVTMQNGFHVLGTSACASPENYDQNVGERYAYNDAFRQLWPLEGYLLRERLAAAAEQPRVPRIGAQDTRSRGEPRP